MAAKCAKTKRKYEGKFIAFDPAKKVKVIASGRDMGKVIDRARKQGVEGPAVVFVPKKGATYFY